MTTDKNDVVKFVPFSSCINPSFWYELNRVKLDEYKLNDDFKNLTGYYSNCTNNDLPPIMNFDYESFSSQDAKSARKDICVNGTIKVFNTINEFNQLDKNNLLDDLGSKIWSDITDNKAIDDPEILTKFCLITFANLKNYVFHYWFAFPSITFTNKPYHMKKCSKLLEVFNNHQCDSFLNNLTIYNSKKLNQSSYFAINFDSLEITSVKEGVSNHLDPNKRVLFGFYDPNSQTNYPGWPLRNYLALLSFHCKNSSKKSVEILSFRDRYKDGNRFIEHSLVFETDLNDVTDSTHITTVGWERNEKNQLLPKIVDMSSTMNSEKLAESAVSLNLKLMKWRIMPNIDLEIIKSKKCLLLGSGTLGCNVARTLLAWGVDTITFVDNSKVSFSNPVRQSLFVFDDSVSAPGKDTHKCHRAAANLKKIYPGVNSKGIVLSIPMPGHFVNENIRSKIQQDVAHLEQLIKEHDCIFLLMDTRESRWLPTLIAAANGKLVINSALGFDSFLVMRHGVRNLDRSKETTAKETNYSISKIPSENLGCYFCNDIVAPGNSTVDRTLDQQCTVSRPGLSMIASALAVELMVTILQHPLKEQAPSYTNNNSDMDYDTQESCLGIVPHQLRGYLHSYSIISPASQAFDKCTACSNSIIDMYLKEGFDFLIKVFNDSKYLEDLTGLTELKTALDENETDFVTELSDSESGF